jgi:hypothetical protein
VKRYGKYRRKESWIVKMIWKIWKKSRLESEMIISLFNWLFFHIFYIFSLFNSFFFHTFQILSLFNCPFFLMWKYGRKVSWIVKWYWKYGRKVSWIAKRYGKCGRKVSWIVNKGNNKITELRTILHYSTCLSSIFSLSFHHFLLYFPNLITIQLGFLPYFSYYF